MSPVVDRKARVPTPAERSRDRELLAAIEDHESIGERYARTGEIPVSTAREPGMAPSPGSEMERDPTPVKPIPKPPRFVGRIVVRVVLGLVALASIYYLVSLWQVWSAGRTDEARPVDAIVVLGAAQYDGTPSPQLAARLDHVVELWDADLAPIVAVTGGNQPGDRFTEAEASAAYLVERGVPAEAIVREDSGTSTYESLDAVRGLLGESVETVLIVTDPYHALRSELIADEVGFTAYASPTQDSVVSGTTELRRELQEAAGVAVGRVIGFDRLSALTD